MGTEIERKFLLKDNAWRTGPDGQPVPGTLYRQGYLSSVPGRTVRVRLVSGADGAKGYFTVKGPVSGLVRSEYEYAIPAADAAEMLDTLCERPLIEKTRHKIADGAVVWEIDEFHGENAGLIVAEVELTSAEQRFDAPAWLGREVSDDVRYFNSRLVMNPYSTWKDNA